MPELHPGGEMTYLDLYREVVRLGFSYGQDFFRGMSWDQVPYLEVSDDVYNEWQLKNAPVDTPDEAAPPDERGEKAAPAADTSSTPAAKPKAAAEKPNTRRGASRNKRSGAG